MDQGSGIALSCGVGRRCGSVLALLWLWLWPTATAPIGLLAWEPLYAAGATLKDKQTNKQTKDCKKIEITPKRVVSHFANIFSLLDENSEGKLLFVFVGRRLEFQNRFTSGGIQLAKAYLSALKLVFGVQIDSWGKFHA